MTMIWLDAYERHARLAPGLLALLPIPVTVVALGLGKAPLASGLVSLLSVCGGPLLLAGIARSAGLRVQADLWAKWGGSPTTSLLRLRGPSDNPVLRDMWRNAVEELGGQPLLSLRAERSSPTKADNTIDAAMGRVREFTRDPKKYPMVWAENRNYGFYRNLYGIRSLGRWIALGALVLTVTVTAGTAMHEHRHISILLVGGIVIDGLLLALWFLLPTEGHVKLAAEKYANQILQAATAAAGRSTTKRPR